ncbi:hypothetical protein HPC37_02840 [Pasteurellaceae bacterium 20609_3]|uniref:hypothetical protein n=1 Tax=Spirabiliibacterium mucosae TaxID=28156 RepID=UPI001AADAFEE|nr:hypothetical protein [Spirabiliibacterium mucosae]MBE2897791.1 hypothetical protein [Spirabiliibacterium mucosae]
MDELTVQEMRVDYPLLGINLTPKEERYVRFRLRGLTPTAAAKHAGLPSTAAEIRALHDRKPQIDQAIIYYREQIREKAINAGLEIEFSRADAHMMYLDAYNGSANSTEKIKATDSMVKLWGLAAPEKKQVEITNRKQLESMSDQELQKLTGMTYNLDPEDYTVSD